MKKTQMSNVISNYKTKLFGLLPNGDEVGSCELTNNKGMCLQVINFGAVNDITIKNNEFRFPCNYLTTNFVKRLSVSIQKFQYQIH
ncbi:hypothetical protein [Flavobacterium gillisiae]|nr:hypothetical protein [Flavobacterium gillisiae]